MFEGRHAKKLRQDDFEIIPLLDNHHEQDHRDKEALDH